MVDKKQYKLKISIDNIYIYFNIKQLQDINFIQYKNKYKLEEILEILKIPKSQYNKLSNILKFLDKVYYKKNYQITYDERNNTFCINIKVSKVFQEYNTYIILNKEEITNKKKFELLYKEIYLLKQDLLKKNKTIDNLLKTIKYLNELKISNTKKIYENEEKIKSLKNEILNNYHINNKNEKDIKILKSEIENLKEIILNTNNKKKKNNKNDIIKDKKIKINDNNINKKENNINNINKSKIKNNEVSNNLIDYKIEKIDYKSKPKSIFLKFRIILVGGTSTGKTSLVEKFMGYNFSNMIHVSAYTNIAYLKINNIPISIYIIDPPGQERFQSIMINSCQDKDMIVFVYSVNNSRDSFKTVKFLIKIIKNEYNNIHYSLIGTMADLEDKRKISMEEGEELAKEEGMDFFMEVSAHSGYNIDKMFFEIAKILYKSRQSI